jgi:hypothetical protein
MIKLAVFQASGNAYMKFHRSFFFDQTGHCSGQRLG